MTKTGGVTRHFNFYIMCPLKKHLVSCTTCNLIRIAVQITLHVVFDLWTLYSRICLIVRQFTLLSLCTSLVLCVTLSRITHSSFYRRGWRFWWYRYLRCVSADLSQFILEGVGFYRFVYTLTHWVAVTQDLDPLQNVQWKVRSTRKGWFSVPTSCR